MGIKDTLLTLRNVKGHKQYVVPAMAFTLIILRSGCKATPIAPYRPPPEPQTREGLKLSEGQAQSLKLKQGMTRVQVEAILGLPDQTEVSTFGRQTAQGTWTGLVWKYKWPGWSP